MSTDYDKKRMLHLGTTPRQEISIQKEIDDVALRTIHEIAYLKNVKANEEPSDVEKITKKLEPDFVSKRRFEPRKSKPVFHEPGTAQPKTPRPLPEKLANVPGYNQLEKPVVNPIFTGKTKKYPYSKGGKVTTADMVKAKRSSVGVLPNSRQTTEIQNLNILLEGETPSSVAQTGLHHHIDVVSSVNNQADFHFDFGSYEEYKKSVTETSGPPKKPAILSQTGTTSAVAMSERPQPMAKKPSIDLELAKKKAAARERRLKKLLKEQQLREEKERLEMEKQNGRPGSDASSSSVRSMQDLVEEAENIAAGAYTGSKVVKTSKIRKSKHSDVVAPEKTVRNVDEIIASLKTQTIKGELESEADKQIREIMGRVMKHATAVLGDIDTTTESPTVMEDSEKEADDAKINEETITDEDPLPNITVEATETSTKDVPTEPVTEATPSPILSKQSAVSNKTPSLSEEVLIDRVASENNEKNGGTEEGKVPDLYDLRAAYNDLIITPQVTHEDIVSVHGKVKTFVSKLLDDGRSAQEVKKHLINVHDNVRSYVSKHGATRTEPAARMPEYKVPNYTRNVHYFCTAKHGVQMPSEMAKAVRLYHAPDMFKRALKDSWALNEHHLATNDANQDHSFQVSEEADIISDSNLARRRSAAARAILDEASAAGGIGYSRWREKAQELFQDNRDMSVTGTKTGIILDESKTFWSTAPPKMSVRPAYVRQHLFPEYYGAVVEDEGLHTDKALEDNNDMFSDAEDEKEAGKDMEEQGNIERVLLRRHHSAQDLTHSLKVHMEREAKKQAKVDAMFNESTLDDTKSEEKEAEGSDVERITPEMEKDKLQASSKVIYTKSMDSSSKVLVSDSTLSTYSKDIKTASTRFLTEEEMFPVELLPRSSSAPSLIELSDDFVAIPEDYVSAMSELDRQRRQIKEMKVNKANRELMALQLEEEKEDAEVYFLSDEEISQKRKELVSLKPSLAEQALNAGRNYVVIKKKKRKTEKTKKPVDFSRLEEIEKFLYSPANPLTRSTSKYNLRKVLPERSLRVPQHVRDRRRGSIPDLLNWEEYTSRNEMPEDVDQREWARDIWNFWFDETFPPEVEGSENEEASSEKDEAADDHVDAAQKEADNSSAKRESIPSMQSEKNLISDEEFSRIESLEPLSDETEDEMIMREALEEEANKVKERMQSQSQPLPFDFCRLGAIQRKLGQLKSARQNLDKALELEPSLVHAYWQRHLLFLLQGKKTEAIEDLNHILKVNRLHAGAYISRAELLVHEDPTMAVTNLTQAIKIQPNNADIYLRRAKLYQDRQQVLLAMEDYAKAYKLNPKLTNAIFSRAKYYFSQNNWQAAINDFSEFLRKCPFDANARLLRGCAYTKQSNYQKAVQDLSAAIHLDPNSWEAFYHRACIFRKVMPKQALLDYSMSILINDSEDNIKSLLHRGVLYDAMDQPEDAISDFEAILKLRKDVAVAHLNLGLIYLTKLDAFQKAIRKFTAAIKCDPTFVRAYICRAEAYTKIHDHKNALLDYTRAIHLRPEVPDYYMHRGMMLLKAGNTDLAAFCVKHVSELFADLDLGQSATQQAVVHGFLKNYPKAILALDKAIKVGPNPPLYILLGKTQMKAKLWNDAINSFTSALEALKPWRPKDKWPKEAAEVSYLHGLCSLELRNYLQAHDSFNNAIEIDKKYAIAYYQRGVAKLRLKQHKGLQDINRALAIDRTIFQAYLTRAAYYGVRKQYSKAIMNCNEAIKLKPQSVRGYLYRGALKYHIRAYELAIKDLTQATKIDNQCSLAYFNRAVCYHNSGQYDKALNDYGIVLLLGEQLMLKVLINRGLLYLSLRDYKNALNDFLLAAKVNSSDSKIRHTLGLCMHKLKQLKEAVAIFSESLAIDKFFMEAYVSRGNAFLDYGNPEGIKAAQADYERALLLKPTYLPARINLAYSLQMSGKFQQAWTQFTIAIQQDQLCQAAYEGRAIVNLQMSNLFAALQDVNASMKVKASAELHTNRGVVSLFMKDSTGAMHDFQAAIKLDNRYSLAYFNAANIYFKNRQFRQAIEYYNRSIQFNNKDESAYVNRAIARAVIKDSSGALSDFSKAISISPKSAHVYFNRGNLYSTLGEWQKAADDFSHGLRLQPDDPLAHKRRADALGKLGMKEKAIADYQYAVQLQARIKFLKSIHSK